MSDSSISIKSVYDEAFSDIKIDNRFLGKIARYADQFANKNQDHIEFFGGVLMGVQRVRFRPEDRNEWFEDVLNIDEHELRDELHRVPDIVPSFIVSSDPMNVGCMYMLHAIETSKHLTDKQKYLGKIDTLMVVQYKFITSILSNWFKYNANKDVAVATYAALNKRFGLKKYGSWKNLLMYRAEQTLIHYKDLIETFDDDIAIIKMVNDVQGRVKSILKYIRDVFSKVAMDPKGLIKSTKATQVNLDGEVTVKDITRYQNTYSRYITTLVPDEGSFIKPELITIIGEVMTTCPERALEDSLKHISKEFKKTKPFVDKVIEHTFDNLSQLRGAERRLNDLDGMMKRLKGLYLASKSNNDLLKAAKDEGDTIVFKAIRSKNKALISSVRSAVMLYIVLRTFTMHHYER